MVNKMAQAEYIWLDGNERIQDVRSKTKIVVFKGDETAQLSSFPIWNFDGSSTNQSSGHDSDLTLKPVRFVDDPIRGKGNYLVLCEVFNPDGTAHATNGRARLREALDKGGASHKPWFGFEQEYTFFKGRDPLGWPEGGYPPPQGPYYCSVGATNAFGRKIVEAHTDACLKAGILIYGTNAEVMAGQWEFQIGFRGDEQEIPDSLIFADHLWIARWLLHLVAEEHGVQVSFDVKPIKGDWNGAGMHTNFSTNETRDHNTGMSAIENAITKLGKRHEVHIQKYGHALHERLTGHHETASIHEFKSGVANRGASIRIPRSVSDNGYGYLEDRRPGANADPYEVSALLTETCCVLS